MFENPRRGRQAGNFTTYVPKILDQNSSSEQIFSENCRWVPLSGMFIELQPITGEIFTPQKLQATNGFRSVMEQIIFVLFKDTNCLIRTLKHRCSPRSVPRTASSASFDFRKKSFRSQRDATATSFPCNDISREENKK